MFRVKRFHSYLYGYTFTLMTDHKPLLGLLGERRAIPPQASARIQRWALTLAMYEYTPVYRSTGAHGNGDAMHESVATQTAASLSTSARRSCLANGATARFPNSYQENNHTSSTTIKSPTVHTARLAQPLSRGGAETILVTQNGVVSTRGMLVVGKQSGHTTILTVRSCA